MILLLTLSDYIDNGTIALAYITKEYKIGLNGGCIRLFWL